MSSREESEIQSLLDSLGTHPDRGLSEVEAYNRLRRFGTNELERPYLRSRQAWSAALLCVAVAIVLAAEGELAYASCAATIGVGLLILALVLKDRYRDAIAASREMVPDMCSAIRGGRLFQLPVYQLVRGDIVRIQAGEIVPADGRLTEAVNMVVLETVLSGSAEPVEKDALHPSDTSEPSGTSKNRIFMSTIVVGGRGTFVVTETGRNTRIGGIRSLKRRKRGRPSLPAGRAGTGTEECRGL